MMRSKYPLVGIHGLSSELDIISILSKKCKQNLSDDFKFRSPYCISSLMQNVCIQFNICTMLPNDASFDVDFKPTVLKCSGCFPCPITSNIRGIRFIRELQSSGVFPFITKTSQNQYITTHIKHPILNTRIQPSGIEQYH